MMNLKNHYLNYNWHNDNLGIERYLEVGNKKTNCWWKNLSNRYKLFDVFKSNAHKFYNNIPFNIKDDTSKSAKTCPAIGDGLLNKTIIIKSPCDILINVQKDGGYYYEIPDKRFLTIATHSPDQFWTSKNNIFQDYFNLKFELPIQVSTNGLPFMFLDPQYHNLQSPFKVINGVIEGKYTKSQPLNINTLMHIQEEKTLLIKEGDVLAYLWTPESCKLKYDENLVDDLHTTFTLRK